MNAETTTPITERSLAERQLRNALQQAEMALAEARVAQIDWSTLKNLARAKIKMDLYTPAVTMLDKGRDVADAIRAMVEHLTEALLSNHHRPCSTCPFSNGMEIERNDVAAYERRFWKGILIGIEREDVRLADLATAECMK